MTNTGMDRVHCTFVASRVVDGRHERLDLLSLWSFLLLTVHAFELVLMPHRIIATSLRFWSSGLPEPSLGLYASVDMSRDATHAILQLYRHITIPHTKPTMSFHATVLPSRHPTILVHAVVHIVKANIRRNRHIPGLIRHRQIDHAHLVKHGIQILHIRAHLLRIREGKESRVLRPELCRDRHS